MKISGFSVVLMIITSCTAPCIAGDNSANNTSSSNRTEEFNITRTMIPSPSHLPAPSLFPSPFYAGQFPPDDTRAMHVYPQKPFRHEIYMPDDAYASFSVRNNTKVSMRFVISFALLNGINTSTGIYSGF